MIRLRDHVRECDCDRATYLSLGPGGMRLEYWPDDECERCGGSGRYDCDRDDCDCVASCSTCGSRDLEFRPEYGDDGLWCRACCKSADWPLSPSERFHVLGGRIDMHRADPSAARELIEVAFGGSHRDF